MRRQQQHDTEEKSSPLIMLEAIPLENEKRGVGARIYIILPDGFEQCSKSCHKVSFKALKSD